MSMICLLYTSCLHGGGGSPDTPFHNSQDQVKDYAERDGYILIAPDGSTNNSTYGCAVPPNGMLGARSDAKDPANPENLSEEELRSVQMGELGLDQVLALARRDYAVDEAVSYTHLDVYKRQAFTSTAAAMPRATAT